jgi:Putative auto-transporter adhesin, head GIN domain
MCYNKRIRKMRINMKRIYPLSLLILLICTSLSALGMNKEPQFEIGEFHSIQVNIPCTITIIRGNDFLMDIEADKNRIQELDIYNDKGTLVFKLKERNLLRLFEKNNPKIILTMPEWRNIRLTSSADISSDDYWENAEISIKNSASGSINLGDVKADAAEIRASASGDINLGDLDLKGPLELLVSGSGNIEADSVSSASVKIKNNASGEIDLGDVNASEGKFELKSSGSGDNSFSLVLARNVQLIGQSSGEIRGFFNSDSLEVKLSGSGDVKLQGRTGIASLRSNSSGSVDASQMVIGEATISGSGSGDIFLKQGTTIREVSFSGSGKLISR